MKSADSCLTLDSGLGLVYDAPAYTGRGPKQSGPRVNELPAGMAVQSAENNDRESAAVQLFKLPPRATPVSMVNLAVTQWRLRTGLLGAQSVPTLKFRAPSTKNQ
eukprot:m.446331 g.446331  ORF g.446331 m.446331 type:complete len:105 (-) comp19346_c0_seq1:1716-2030(-)